MRKDYIGKDKSGREWSVHVDILKLKQDSNSLTTFVAFYVYSLSRKLIKDSSNHIGEAHLTIQASTKYIAKIEDIRIELSYRGRRIGSLLLDYVEQWAIHNNIKILQGDLVRIDQDHISVLKSLYKKHGFVVKLFNKPLLDPRVIGKINKTIV